MARPKGSGQGLVPLGLKVEAGLYNAVVRYAEHHHISLSAAGGALIRESLSRGGQLGGLAGKNLRDTGFNEGVRRGLHEFRVGMKNMTDTLWK